MSRTKDRGTVAKGPTVPNPKLSVGGILDLAEQQVKAADAEALVSKTLLAAVLNELPAQVATITPETIAKLQGKSFSIQRRTNEQGGIEVRLDIEPDIIEAEVVEDEKPTDPKR